jgi:microcin C transport system substrate-binding protein
MILRPFLALITLLPLYALAASINTAPQASHALAMHGVPKYAKDFSHFEYANPTAIKGGTLKQATISSGGFDSLNPFIVKGIAAAGIGQLGNSYLYDSLMVNSLDEPFTQYGLVAEKITVPDDRSWIIFDLNPKARFHDGEPMTADDVIFTFNLLTTEGHPLYASYYKNVSSVTKLAERKVKFTFDSNDNRELPLIIGQLPVLPAHYWQGKDFNKTSLTPPLGSGPYRIANVDAGHSITYDRIPDYWAKDLGVNKGQYNFEKLHYDYYRDNTVALEAFKAGNYDFRSENSSKNWATAYDGEQLKSGQIIKESLPNRNPSGMQAFIFNTRNALFQDSRVREALNYAFDFEWTNKQLFYGSYKRTQSYFDSSELASTELPSEAEIAILAPYRDKLPAEVFTTIYNAPKTDGSGNNRKQLRAAITLLKAAGWHIKNGKLTNANGDLFTIELLLASPAMERVAHPFKKNLKKLGIELNIRMVDTQQYIKRYQQFDFDMIIGSFGQSNSPGNEQRDFWGSTQADQNGSRNTIGIKSPVIDALIERLITATDREDLIASTRALDRVLLWNHYVIPHWHINSYRVAYWDKFTHPKTSPIYGFTLDTWWMNDTTKPAQQ